MRRAEQKPHMDGLLVLAIFAVFALCVLGVLGTGADSYRRLTARDEQAYGRRTGPQYIATKVRQADAAGQVRLGSFDGAISADGSDGGDTLFLEEYIDGALYHTRVYYDNGYIWELFSDAETELAPEDGEKILAAQGLSFRWASDGERGRLLMAEFTDTDGAVEEVALALRSGEGAAS